MESAEANHSETNNVTGPSPHREDGNLVEFPINNTSVNIDQNHMVETESSAPGIYTSENNTDSVKVIGSDIVAESELKNYSHALTDFKMTIETEECSCDRTCSKTEEQIEDEKNSEENNRTITDVSWNGKEDETFKCNTTFDMKVLCSQTPLETDTDMCHGKETTDGKTSLETDTYTCHGKEMTDGRNPLETDTNTCHGKEMTDGKTSLETDTYMCHGKKMTDGKTSAHSVELGRCLSDAPLTHVDEDDGLLKTFGKLCGINKKQLLYEDKEPYCRSPVTASEVNSPELAETPSADNDNMCAGSSFERTTTLNSDRKSSHPRSHDICSKIPQRVVSPESQAVPSKTNSVPAQRPKISRVKQSIPEDVYDFTHGKRGYMLLIVNDMFDRQSPRLGAHWDLLKMKEIARKFGFRSLNYNQERNLTKAQTISWLKQAQNTDHSDCDCFMFMISTHGLEHRNALKRGQVDHALVCKDEELIFTSSILDMFSDSNCPSLRGKPKLFYIQACRGEKLDSGGKIRVLMPVDKPDTGQLGDDRMRPEPKSQDSSDTRPGADSWTQKPIVHEESRTHPQSTGNAFYQPGSSYYQSLSQNQRAVNHHYQHRHQYLQMQATAQSFHQSRLEKSEVKTSVPSHVINKIYSPTPYAIAEAPSLKCDNDMMVMFAIPPGMFAWRNTSDGSWMIDYLHQVLMAYDMKRPKSFLNLMSKVSALMSRRTTHTPSSPSMHEKKAVSVIEHKLTKDILMQQKVPVSDWKRKSHTFEFDSNLV